MATRRAIDDAIGFLLGVIDKQVENFSWLGLVIDFEGGEAYFNAGSDKEIRIGDRFRISTVKKVLTDPETNRIIGLIEGELGLAEAVWVDRKYTKARVLGNFVPHQGDIVRFADKKRNEINTRYKEPLGYDVME